MCQGIGCQGIGAVPVDSSIGLISRAEHVVKWVSQGPLCIDHGMIPLGRTRY